MNKLITILFLSLLIQSCAKPMADFIITPQGNYVPVSISIENNSKNAETYEWDFGDGEVSSEANPKHNYSLSGRYVVTLKAKNKKNKVDEVSKEIFFDAPEDCQVLIQTTLGDIVFELSDETPRHRDNMIKLINDSYYDSLLFHRVIKGFMAQCGDPGSRNAGADTRLGGGGPSYTIRAEINDDLVHLKGAIAAARQGDNVNPDKRSSGSQFYIVHGASVSEQSLDRQEQKTGIIYSDEIREKYYAQGGTPFLDYGYTVFGQVIKGFDIIDKIANTSTKPGDRPIEDVRILKLVLIK